MAGKTITELDALLALDGTEIIPVDHEGVTKSVSLALIADVYALPGPQGETGASAYDEWVLGGGVGDEAAFLADIEGATGATGDSAYQVWLDNGGVGDEAAFLADLVGATGATGLSAYDEWVLGGGVGDEAAFLASLVGPEGPTGPVGMVWRAAWDSGTAYAVDDAVSYLGGSWIAVQAGTNHIPADDAWWDPLAAQGAPGAGNVNTVNGEVGPDIVLSGTDIPFTPGSGWSSTNVEDAIRELEGDLEATGTDLFDHQSGSANLHPAAAIDYAGGTGLSATTVEGALDELATEKSNVGHTHSVTIPETHTYAVIGAVTTATVFPAFFTNEDYGTLTLVSATVKLTSGTATMKIRVNGVDQVTGLAISSSATNHNFTAEDINDLDGVDIVLTAAASAVDLSVTLHFVRVLTVS